MHFNYMTYMAHHSTTLVPEAWYLKFWYNILSSSLPIFSVSVIFVGIIEEKQSNEAFAQYD